MGGCHGSNNKNQEETCVIIFFFLSKDNLDNLKKKLQGIYDISVDQVMIFSSLRINQHKVFISNGEILKSQQEYHLYLSSCNLEGRIKQIFTIIDQKTYYKFIKSSFYKFITNNKDFKDFTTFLLLEEQQSGNSLDEQTKTLKQFGSVQNFVFFKKQNAELNFLGLLNCQSGNNLNFDFKIPQFKNHDIFVQNYIQYLNQQYQNLGFQNQFVKEIDSIYQILIQARNKSLYDCSSQIDDKTQIHFNAISLKFNLKILDLIHDFTHAILDKIANLQQKFQKQFVLCNKCKSVFYPQEGEGDEKEMIRCQFYNSFQKSCVTCQSPYKPNQNEINSKFNFKLQFLNISSIQNNLKQLTSQNKIVQTPIKIEEDKMNQGRANNGQGNIKESEDQEKRIILIGKSGVGKTFIFNKLCGKKQENKNNQDKFIVNDQLCKNNLFYVMDTPTFELRNEQNQLDFQQIENFGDLIVSTKLNQIFIVTNYDRIENMKMKIMDCFKYLYQFQSKISIIIMNLNTNLSEISIQNDLLELKNQFQIQNWLNFNMHDEEQYFIEQISKSIESTDDSFLNTKDTFFDRTKAKLTESQFGQSLNKLKNQKLKDQKNEEIQKITQKLQKDCELQKQYQKQISKLNSYKQELLQTFYWLQAEFEKSDQQKKKVVDEDLRLELEIEDQKFKIFQLSLELQAMEMTMK